jgi:acyl-CoA thioesterase-1
VVVWWTGVGLELPFHLSPSLPPLGNPTVFVVGDSVSAGMGGERQTWPRLLSDRHGVHVHDLSLAGATVATALRDQAGGVTESGALVVLEIGGNDVLGGTASEAFERDLDALLTSLRGGGDRTVVMLELPLPPLHNRFGAAQRRLAARHGVVLVPKRVLFGVLTARGATLDTIHLTQTGHTMMAEAMWQVLQQAFVGRR